MRKILLILTLIAMAVSCKEKPQALVINNSLTDAEKSTGVFTPEVMWKMGRVAEPQMSPSGESVAFTTTYYNLEENRGVSSIYVMPSSGGEPVQVTDNAARESSLQWVGNKIYFLSNRSGDMQLWSIMPDGSDMTQCSEIEGGIDSYGIASSGTKAFYTQSVKCGKNPHEDMSKSEAKVYDDLMARHWARWTDGTYSHIFVADFDGKLSVGCDIMPGEEWDAPLAPYFDAAEIAWSNSGDLLAYTCKKLKGVEYAVSTDSDIFIYDTKDGSTRNITEGMVGYDKYPRFSPDDSKIAFVSMERAGVESDKTRLMVKDLATGQMDYLTSDFDYNADNISWRNNDEILFLSPMNATYQLCQATKDSVTVITEGLQDYTAYSFSGDKAVATMNTLSSAAEIYSIALADGKATKLTDINREIYENIPMGKVEKRFIKTTDNKNMLTWVVFPPNFDATKKYPTLLYCQGGPQSVVSQFWSYRWNLQLMAAQGYIVVAPNRRGLPSFGQEWLDQISGDYSGQNITDYLSAIDNVSAEPWSDENRLGCVGASYGGYSAYYLAGHHDGRFKAFISHCGMFNFESFYGSTEELWFPNRELGGAPWSDDATAKRSYANSPHKFVDKWDTPILIVAGLNDFRIPYTESLQAFTAARLHEIPARLVTFPDEAHQVFKPQNSIIWNREFFGWLSKYL